MGVVDALEFTETECFEYSGENCILWDENLTQENYVNSSIHVCYVSVNMSRSKSKSNHVKLYIHFKTEIMKSLIIRSSFKFSK